MRTSTLILLLGLVIAVGAQESSKVHKHEPDRGYSFDQADPNECKENGPTNDEPAPQDAPKDNPSPNNGGDVSECRDTDKRCTWMEPMCKDELSLPMMVGACPKTCNFCKAWKNGPNSSAKCKNFAYTCARKSLDCTKEVNKVTCPFTCKICT